MLEVPGPSSQRRKSSTTSQPAKTIKIPSNTYHDNNNIVTEIFYVALRFDTVVSMLMIQGSMQKAHFGVISS